MSTSTGGNSILSERAAFEMAEEFNGVPSWRVPAVAAIGAAGLHFYTTVVALSVNAIGEGPNGIQVQRGRSEINSFAPMVENERFPTWKW